MVRILSFGAAAVIILPHEMKCSETMIESSAVGRCVTVITLVVGFVDRLNVRCPPDVKFGSHKQLTRLKPHQDLEQLLDQLKHCRHEEPLLWSKGRMADLLDNVSLSRWLEVEDGYNHERLSSIELGAFVETRFNS